MSVLIGVGGSPMNDAVNCHPCPVLSDVALRMSAGTLFLRRQLWLPALAALFAAFGVTLLAAAAALFPALDRWQDLGAIVRRVDHDVGDRTLVLYAPDETIVATLDRVLAGRRQNTAQAKDLDEAQALLQSKEPPVFLVKLRGMGRGRVLDQLKRAGVKMETTPDTPELRALTTALPLVLERIYELPQGRRYALLAEREVTEPLAMSRQQ